LSTTGVQVVVETSAGLCESCEGPTRVQKTRIHRAITLEHGAVWVLETIRVCAAGCQHPSGARVLRRSEALSCKVPPGAVYGYDLEVFVGLKRFREHRQREEIREALRADHGIELSSGEVSRLTRRFIEHLAELHQMRAPDLRRALERDGGYAMHIDATGEDGRGTLFMTYAGSRQWVLGAWKIATERADLILPCLRQTVAEFGPPIAIMRDLGKAVIPAARVLVDEIGRPIAILSCHFHFLRDVGNDLLLDGHGAIRDLFRRFRIRPALRALVRHLAHRLRGRLPALRKQVATWIETQTEHVIPDGKLGLATVRALAQWILDYPAEAPHGVPFDLPYLALYRRCLAVRRAVDAYLRRPPTDAAVQSVLLRVARLLDPLVTEVSFQRHARTLAARAALFTELRDALRIQAKEAERLASTRLDPEQAAAQLRDIHAAVEELTRSLRDRRPERGPAEDARQAIDLVLDHLDRHGNSLWGHVITLPAEAGGGVRVVDRTNQCEEGFWHRLKHGERRRSGRKILTHDFEGLPAAATLACNLEHEDYVALLCGSLEELPLAFARLDQARRHRSQALPQSPARPAAQPPLAVATDGAGSLNDLEEVVSASLPRDDRQLVRASRLGDRIETAARSRAPRRIPA
jgi:hypothetical protein